MSFRGWLPSALAACLVAMGVLYWGVGAGLLRDWLNDDNYSHGLLIVPLAAYFVVGAPAQACRADASADCARSASSSPEASRLLVAGTLARSSS